MGSSKSKSKCKCKCKCTNSVNYHIIYIMDNYPDYQNEINAFLNNSSSFKLRDHPEFQNFLNQAFTSPNFMNDFRAYDSGISCLPMEKMPTNTFDSKNIITTLIAKLKN